MVVRCPNCKNVIRLREVDGQSRVIKYLCSNCQEVVRIDLLQDEVKSSSTSDSFEKTEHRKKILVADDTVTVRKVAARLLIEAGYDVLEAVDGRQALDLVQNEHPDLILLDLLMPKMTGFDVLREIKKTERIKKTPILIMSGVFKKDVLDFLQASGVAGFVDKDQIKDSLIFRVKQILVN
ncbi:MAG TPA: response regulator [Candidatus Polarisedimenticolia bacterium]|nr:response regulator [Candidatus Polarisedimenticolia bacterium]